MKVSDPVSESAKCLLWDWHVLCPGSIQLLVQGFALAIKTIGDGGGGGRNSGNMGKSIATEL
jgi:hypothetical protein